MRKGVVQGLLRHFQEPLFMDGVTVYFTGLEPLPLAFLAMTEDFQPVWLSSIMVTWATWIFPTAVYAFVLLVSSVATCT